MTRDPNNPPPREPGETDKSWAAFLLRWQNPDHGEDELAGLLGTSPEALRKLMERNRHRERIAAWLAGPKPPTDPIKEAKRHAARFLAEANAIDSVIDAKRILEIPDDVTQSAEPPDWYPAFRADLDRALFSDLPPVGTKAVDLRRLTAAQRECFAFLVDRALGSTAPWRQAGETAPGSAVVAEPEMEKICNGEEP